MFRSSDLSLQQVAAAISRLSLEDVTSLRQSVIEVGIPVSCSMLTRQPDREEYVVHLETELRLMSSAFHNLSLRLQMSNITLLRRADVPKSWLGRQRKAVEGPVGLTR